MTQNAKLYVGSIFRQDKREALCQGKSQQRDRLISARLSIMRCSLSAAAATVAECAGCSHSRRVLGVCASAVVISVSETAVSEASFASSRQRVCSRMCVQQPQIGSISDGTRVHGEKWRPDALQQVISC